MKPSSEPAPSRQAIVQGRCFQIPVRISQSLRVQSTQIWRIYIYIYIHMVSILLGIVIVALGIYSVFGYLDP